ncbi:hypothetical protein ACRAWD_18795 [Caulobacter segnis]
MTVASLDARHRAHGPGDRDSRPGRHKQRAAGGWPAPPPLEPDLPLLPAVLLHRLAVPKTAARSRPWPPSRARRPSWACSTGSGTGEAGPPCGKCWRSSASGSRCRRSTPAGASIRSTPCRLAARLPSPPAGRTDHGRAGDRAPGHGAAVPEPQLAHLGVGRAVRRHQASPA